MAAQTAVGQGLDVEEVFGAGGDSKKQESG
jgi:hypothetical protein